MAESTSSDAAASGHESDLALVRRARLRDPAAVESLCRRLECIPAMLRDRHQHFGSPLNRDELEDVQQNVLAALWSKLGDFEGRASLETWVFRFTVNELLKGLARRDRQRRRVPDGDDILSQVESAADREPALDHGDLESGLEQLGPPASDIIRWRHFDERSFDEIAANAREPVSTVKARYYRGLEKLREILRPRFRRGTQ